jgi:hypothetical protein
MEIYGKIREEKKVLLGNCTAEFIINMKTGRSINSYSPNSPLSLLYFMVKSFIFKDVKKVMAAIERKTKAYHLVEGNTCLFFFFQISWIKLDFSLWEE